jgi:hypothetical protein
MSKSTPVQRRGGPVRPISTACSCVIFPTFRVREMKISFPSMRSTKSDWKFFSSLSTNSQIFSGISGGRSAFTPPMRM